LPVTVAAVMLGAVALAFALHQAARRGREPRGPVALERVARAVVDAYVALGEITPRAAASLTFAPRLGGRVRCALSDGSAAENRAFASALEEALGSAAGHRYLVSRALVAPAGAAPRRLARALGGRERADEHWHPVPSDLGRNRGRADAYLAAWRQWVSPEGELRYTVGSEEGRQLLLEATAEPSGHTASHRTLWV
ncbi:MAG TPA: hypothetical protein VLK58_23100, partial [Conexibacter sp.]|nr:hypothetical protein [Conexibacter sp.]